MKRFLTIALVTMVTTLSLAQAQTAKPAAAASKALAMIQGTWILTSMGGQDLTGAPEFTVTMTENKYVLTQAGEVAERGTFKLDETKKPMTIDLAITEGDDAGKSQVGVIEITETTMKGKLTAPDNPQTRPTNFEQEDGFVVFMATKKK